MSDCVVYWLYDETCSEPEKDGYVGITANKIEQRIAQHRHNRRFPKGFKWSILFQGTWDQCCERERQLRPVDWIGWNKVRGGDIGVPPGYKFSEEVSKKRSAAFKGRPKSEEHRRKIAAALTGHVRTVESRLKQGASAKGKPKSPEWRKWMSEQALARGGFFKGTHDDEAKAKMRAAQARIKAEREAKGLPHHAVGKRWSPETRAKHASRNHKKKP